MRLIKITINLYSILIHKNEILDIKDLFHSFGNILMNMEGNQHKLSNKFKV